MHSNALASAHRQMGAVIAKLMDGMEGIDALQALHPYEFTQVRKLAIRALWDAYNIGVKMELRRAEEDGNIHQPQYRAEPSPISG